MLLKSLGKILLSLFTLILLGTSCSCRQRIIGQKYIAVTESRELEIEILDENKVRFTNRYSCTNVPEKYKNLIFIKEYNFKNNKLILKDSIFEMNLPYINNSDCKFLSEEYRKKEDKRMFDGRLLILNKKELYSIENIDTLMIRKNKLLYYKNKQNGTKGYLFYPVK